MPRGIGKVARSSDEDLDVRVGQGPVESLRDADAEERLADPILGRVAVAAGVRRDGAPAAETPDFRWLIASDVCKHCTHAGCLDVCPTGALFRSELGTVVVQADICNGCGYCVGACPFGVIERRTDATGDRGHVDGGEVPRIGVAQKCTLCYDRLRDDETPACAKTCPTTSIKYGDHDDMVRVALATAIAETD